MGSTADVDQEDERTTADTGLVTLRRREKLAVIQFGGHSSRKETIIGRRARDQTKASPPALPRSRFFLGLDHGERHDGASNPTQRGLGLPPIHRRRGIVDPSRPTGRLVGRKPISGPTRPKVRTTAVRSRARVRRLGTAVGRWLASSQTQRPGDCSGVVRTRPAGDALDRLALGTLTEKRAFPGSRRAFIRREAVTLGRSCPGHHAAGFGIESSPMGRLVLCERCLQSSAVWKAKSISKLLK